MSQKARQQTEQDSALSTLDVSIKYLNIAKDTSSIKPAKDAFGSVNVLLTMIRDTMANEQDFVELGMSCVDVCKALDRGLEGRRSEELSGSLLEAIEQLTTTVATIQRKVIKQGKKNAFFNTKADRDKISAWKQDLNRIVQVFSAELVINTHMLVVDMHRNAIGGQGGPVGQFQLVHGVTSVPLGELPPSPPRDCFGRKSVIEQIIGLAENLQPIALIGAGGIGKTSIALTVLHDGRIRERFGDHRRFIRCDQFPASRPHFLARLSEVIGAGVENPKDLTPLQPFLSSQEMFIILDNAESILDPQGPNAREIYPIVDQLSQIRTLSLCITSRITTVPPHCKRPEIPTLSMEAACDIFHSIYGDRGRSTVISDLVDRLDFHALSIKLSATTASHNAWDCDRLMKEWNTHRSRVLRTDYSESLAATIELSLASPTFQNLGSDARELLGVVAFFPQGVDEKNLDWLFPTIPDRMNVFDKFCTLSLTYRNGNFITALEPIRDYLYPPDPGSSPLLCVTRDRYFTRLSDNISPDTPGFGEARWIASEDVNLEHLLDVFMSADTNSGDVWGGCCRFMEHLYYYKPRPTVFGPKIEGLPDDHPSKPKCLSRLSRLFQIVGNPQEQKRLLTHTLKLLREQGDGLEVAETLHYLSNANRLLQLYEEGIQQAKEASEISERLGYIRGQALCLTDLARLLYEDDQLDAAEQAASHLVDLASETGQESVVCDARQILGDIYHVMGKKKKAIQNLEIALRIASPFGWHNQLFWAHQSLAWVFLDEGKLDSATAHIKQAKSHTDNNAYTLGRAMELQGLVWHKQRRFQTAKSEASGALNIYKKFGVMGDVERCRGLLQEIERAGESPPVSSHRPWYSIRRLGKYFSRDRP